VILIALGANCRPRRVHRRRRLRAALARLGRLGVKIRLVSSLYETPAWPDPAQPVFVNAVAPRNRIPTR